MATPINTSNIITQSDLIRKLFDDFATRYNEVDFEGTRNRRELVHGGSEADYAGSIRGSYNLVTCPGSSGCEIHSYIIKDGDRMVVNQTPHSRGKASGKGFSGLGIAK